MIRNIGDVFSLLSVQNKMSIVYFCQCKKNFLPVLFLINFLIFPILQNTYKLSWKFEWNHLIADFTLYSRWGKPYPRCYRRRHPADASRSCRWGRWSCVIAARRWPSADQRTHTVWWSHSPSATASQCSQSRWAASPPSAAPSHGGPAVLREENSVNGSTVADQHNTLGSWIIGRQPNIKGHSAYAKHDCERGVFEITWVIVFVRVKGLFSVLSVEVMLHVQVILLNKL